MDKLIDYIKNKKVILFVGSGVSINLGLPSWDKLIEYIAIKLGYDPEIFKEFGDHYTLAEYYRLKRGKIGHLRSWMDTKWNIKDEYIKKSDVYRLIVQLNFPIIYTTNYDRLLEKAYTIHKKKYMKIACVKDLAQAKEGVTQIIKFHGDFDDDDSIVLTESSYFERLNFLGPLDIKLKHDLLGKSALFIGYSLRDVNVRYLLYQIFQMWSRSEFSKLRPKSYILLSKPNPILQEVLESRGINTIVSEKDEAGEGLTDFLERLARKVGAL